MLNNITIMGRLTRDPEYRTVGNGTSLVNFRVAVDRDFGPKDGGEKKADFIDCVAWRKTAEFITKHFTKGQMIVVTGRLEMEDYTDKEGNKRTSVKINVAQCYFGDSKSGGRESTAGAYPEPGGRGVMVPDGDFPMLEGDDGQLPF